MIDTDLQRLDAVTAVIMENAPADIANWWRHGVSEFLNSCGRRSLCQCLGINEAWQATSSYHRAKAERDIHLRAARELVPATSLRGIASRIERFKVDLWPRLAAYSRPPTSLTQFELQLFHAFRTGIGVPTSPSQLRQILFGKQPK